MSNEKILFRPLGDPDGVMPVLGQRTAAMVAVDQMFLSKAHKALAEAGISALDFLCTNPGAPMSELAKRLNRGASEMGLIMAIYEQSQQQGMVRDIARNLLIRKIIERYPQGWTSGGTIRAIVRIGGWEDDIRRNVRDDKVVGIANQIICELAINNQPPDGWIPEMRDDPLLNQLFDRFWPIEEGR